MLQDRSAILISASMRAATSIVLGYRALSTDYSTGSGFGTVGMNLLFHGPLIGFGVRF